MVPTPWHIEERNDRYCVIKDDDGENEGCHDTREEAEAQMRALYASEKEATVEMKETFAIADVKAVKGDAPTGEFEAVLSAATVDRDGEVVDKGAFEPLPESVPIHAFHDFHDPVGRGVPYYDGDVLKVRGVFASTPRAQEIRTLVSEGVIGHMSVGFMAAQREDDEKDGLPHVRSAELLEASFVSIPSNREASVLAAKAYAAAVATKDVRRFQLIHDVARDLGADCNAYQPPPKNADPDITKSSDVTPEPSAADEAADPALADTTLDMARLLLARTQADLAL